MNHLRCYVMIRRLPVMLIALAIGCGGPTGDRVSGTVTFDGKPVPAGKIYFAPDSAKGNSGSTGFADIVDGRYDSGLEGGRPIGSGPMVITIEGVDPNAGPNGSESETEEGGATLLFAGYKMEADIEPGNSTLDIEVPAEAAGVPKSEPERQAAGP